MSGHGGPDGPGEDEAEGGAEDMIVGFRRTSRGVSARFTPAQASIVRTLVSQVAELVGGEDTDLAPDPDRGGQAPGDRPGESGAALGEAQDPFSPGELAAMFGQTGPAQLSDDPVLARLFPDAYREDPDAAGDFRRYTEHGLRSGKVAAARTVLATLPDRGGRVRLTAVDGEVWLRALNDVRLALGIRLGISEDYEHELGGISADDPRAAYLQVYDWLTFLQETLVRALW